nr:nickel-dependent hydrogenase large subunit [Methylomonas sp. SURF-2]
MTHRGGQASAARIFSTRPQAATQVLLGKTPEQLLSTVPLLFSLCGNAQSYAALLACRDALGLDAAPEADAARECLLQLETVREHAWRILLDWPGLLGRRPDKATLAALLKLTTRFKPCLFGDGEAFKLDSRLQIDYDLLIGLLAELNQLIDQAIFNGGMRAFQAIADETQLADWLADNSALSAELLHGLYRLDWRAVGRNHIRCLPALDNLSLLAHLQTQELSAFCAAPRWQGQCHESTPLGRQQSRPLIAALQNHYGNGLLARFAAVLREVAEITLGLERFGETPFEPAAAYGGDGIGLAQVPAARGLLVHRLALRNGRVYDYRIVAPTEWNFHPAGVLAQGLTALRAVDADSLRRQAEWLIQSIDPCVPYKLILNET